MSAPLTPWIVFLVAVVALLAIDLGVLGRRPEPMSARKALLWSGIWITLGLAFSLAVWAWRGAVAAQEYLAGYLIEESLSIDNLFVFLLVFGSLGIALRQQRKVLFWGIFGAIVLRGLFIFAGVAVLERFAWVMYVFGALLVFTAYDGKMLLPNMAKIRKPSAYSRPSVRSFGLDLPSDGPLGYPQSTYASDWGRLCSSCLWRSLWRDPVRGPKHPSSQELALDSIQH